MGGGEGVEMDGWLWNGGMGDFFGCGGGGAGKWEMGGERGEKK